MSEGTMRRRPPPYMSVPINPRDEAKWAQTRPEFRRLFAEFGREQGKVGENRATQLGSLSRMPL